MSSLLLKEKNPNISNVRKQEVTVLKSDSEACFSPYA